MAVTIEIADVVLGVCDRTQIQPPAAGEFVTEEIMLRFIKDAAERLGALLLDAYGASHFAYSATLQTQPGLDIVSLPDDFTELRSLHWVRDGQAQQLERAPVGAFDPTPVAWDSADAVAPRYRLESNVLVLTPIPADEYTLKCDYTSGIAFTSLTDSFAGEAGWKEWLVLDVCEQVRDRQEKDASSFTARKVKVEHDLRQRADHRDRFARHQVQDTRGVLAGRTSRARFGY